MRCQKIPGQKRPDSICCLGRQILGRQNHSLKPKEDHMGVPVVPVALCPAHAPAPASSLAAAALRWDRARQKQASVSFVPVYSPHSPGERRRLSKCVCAWMLVGRAGIQLLSRYRWMHRSSTGSVKSWGCVKIKNMAVPQ